MSTDAPAPNASEDAAALSARSAEDWARALMAPQQEFLWKMADSCLAVAKAVEADVVATAASEESRAEDVGVLVLGHQRAARGGRMVVALQSKLVADLQKLERGESLLSEPAEAARPDPALEWRRKKTIGRIIWRVATVERLDFDDIYGEVLSRPPSELVADLCADLGLSPDWPALAEEQWARKEIASGKPGAPLAALIAGADLPPPGEVPREAGGRGQNRDAAQPPSSASPRLPPRGEDHSAAPVPPTRLPWPRDLAGPWDGDDG